MRAPVVTLMLVALAVGCANCDGPARPPVARGPLAPADNAPVVVLDGQAVRVVAPPRVDDAPPPGEEKGPGTFCAQAPFGPAGNRCLTPFPLLENDWPGIPAARPLRPVRRVVVDPGHGGENAGAAQYGTAEKEVNLDVGLRLAEELRRRGTQVTLTRDDDTFVALDERAEVANAAGADLFVSLHSNAAENPAACGIEVYYAAEFFRSNGRLIGDDARARDIGTRFLPDGVLAWDGDLAGLVSAQRLALARDLGRTLGIEIERAMTESLRAPTRGVKPASYEVLRWTACPAVLVEMGFLTNDEDLDKLSDPGYRARIARAIADAIMAYARLAPEGNSP